MIVSHLIEAVLITILGCLLRWENKKRDRIQSQMEGGLEGRDLDATAFLDLTDRENLKYVFLPPLAGSSGARLRVFFSSFIAFLRPIANIFDNHSSFRYIY